MLPLLHEVAGQVLRLQQYHRLHIIAELLDLFSSGNWSQMEEEQRERVLKKLEADFHMRAWDDWDWNADSACSRIGALIADEIKGVTRKLP
jgi:hypothetical protein